jgi:hypothetical protein
MVLVGNKLPTLRGLRNNKFALMMQNDVER